MDYFTILGLIAGTFTTIAFLPQVIKTWKLKQTKDISLMMYIVMLTGVLLWLSYGLIIKDTPIICANIVSAVLISIMIILKLKYG